MALSFHEIEIAEIITRTQDCVSVAFDIPASLEESFQYLPGQYLTLEQTINGEEVRRSYSLCRAPRDHRWEVAIKKVPGGKFSTYANDVLQAGDKIQLGTPEGRFLLKEPGEGRDTYVFFAAGSGITPIMSMIRHLLSETDNDVVLFYGNRTTDSIIFREEIEDLKSKHMNQFTLNHILSKEKLGSPLFFGRIDGSKIESYLKHIIDDDVVVQYSICGPGQMIFEIKDALVASGVEEDKVNFELFTTADMKEATQEVEEVVEDASALVKIRLDGLITEFTVPFGGKAILDAALESGADLPFSCKGGVCCTCRAKLLEGEVKMDVNYALEPDEVKQGFILTCQSHPRSEVLEIDFDEA
ncbi:MAG: 2Fe-2S iron-sulfur cluster binding domain-containing protein [Saprospiraceae bacterium]|nr:2Fe-2S iron-sulfur cluster binding domain-containing protein [Saprospiraceae bacterium]